MPVPSSLRVQRSLLFTDRRLGAGVIGPWVRIGRKRYDMPRRLKEHEDDPTKDKISLSLDKDVVKKLGEDFGEAIINQLQ